MIAMGGAGSNHERALIGQMRVGLRAWVQRIAGEGTRGLRGTPAPVLLSLISAAALSPVLAVVAGLDATAVAVSTVLSSVGGGVLSEIVGGV